MINNSFSKKYGFSPDSCQPRFWLLLIKRREMSEWMYARVQKQGETGVEQRGKRLGTGQPSAVVHRPPRSYENLIVSHTKANQLSILREGFSLSPVLSLFLTLSFPFHLSSETTDCGLHVLRLHPSSCRPLQVSLHRVCLARFISLSLLLACHFIVRALFLFSFFSLSVPQIKMHRGILRLMHLSLRL